MDRRAPMSHHDADSTRSAFDVPESYLVREHAGAAGAGVGALIVAVVSAIGAIACVVLGGAIGNAVWWILFVVLIIATVVIAASLYIIKPNQAAVLTLFGDYRGTDRAPGLRIANPLYVTTKISVRVRNFTTTTSKVNAANGNPIHIAAVVVWRVVDTAAAQFGVDDFVDYVRIQSESAVRHMARAYPYDSFDNSGETTLIGEPQQAAAIVAGRAQIVEGAVGMVKQALAGLEDGSDETAEVHLDGERRAAFAANLMTVIASDSPTNPVVN